MKEEPRQSPAFSRRPVLVLSRWLLIAVVGVLGVDVVAVKYDKPKLDALYAVLRELRLGMSRSEVLDVVKRHANSDLERHDFENGDITLWVHYGLKDSCSLAIGFKAGSLERARTLGEDGGHDKCPSSPPDLRWARSSPQ